MSLYRGLKEFSQNIIVEIFISVNISVVAVIVKCAINKRLLINVHPVIAVHRRSVYLSSFFLALSLSGHLDTPPYIATYRE